jgi:predicted dehydrogenase
LGNAGRRHFNNAAKLGHDVSGFDPRFVSEAPPREEIIATSDAVIIASPSECHLQDLTDCIAARKPVLVEKPIALTGQSKQVEKQLANAADLPIAVGFNLRFHPSIRALCGVIREEPYYASLWCCQYTESKAPLTNGCINEWAPHEIDLARYLISYDLRIIDKHVDKFQVDLTLRNWEQHVTATTVIIHSDMRYRGNKRGGMILTENDKYVWNFDERPISNADYVAELEAFIDYARTGKDNTEALATADDGLACLRICERADNVRFAK